MRRPILGPAGAIGLVLCVLLAGPTAEAVSRVWSDTYYFMERTAPAAGIANVVQSYAKDSSTTTIQCGLDPDSLEHCFGQLTNVFLKDNTTGALRIYDANSQNVIAYNSNNGTEILLFGDADTDPTYQFYGSGVLQFFDDKIVRFVDNSAGSMVLEDANGGDIIAYDSTNGSEILSFANASSNAVVRFLGTGLIAFLSEKTLQLEDDQSEALNIASSDGIKYWRSTTTNSGERAIRGSSSVSNYTYGATECYKKGESGYANAGYCSFPIEHTTSDAADATVYTLAIPDETTCDLYVGVVARDTESGTSTFREGLATVALVYREDAGSATIEDPSTIVRDTSAGAIIVTIEVSGNNAIVVVNGHASLNTAFGGLLDAWCVTTSS